MTMARERVIKDFWAVSMPSPIPSELYKERPSTGEELSELIEL
jgi:hypothetical protein